MRLPSAYPILTTPMSRRRGCSPSILMADTPDPVHAPKPATQRSAPESQGGESPRELHSSRLSFVAHEVRNPLSTALWSAELLARMAADERGGARGEKLAAMCLRALSRVRQLVEDHFVCERLDAGGLPVRPEALSLAERVAEALQRRRPPVVHTAHVEEDLVVHADRALLDRILEALVALAGDGSAVTVEARRSGDEVFMTVSGAPPSPLGLDDPVRGSPPDPRGRSLALPMARRAAAAMGMRLTIDAGAYHLVMAAQDADRET